jgi:hypothetical protein
MIQPAAPGAHLAAARALLDTMSLGPGGSFGGPLDVRVGAAIANSVLALTEQVEMLRQEIAKEPEPGS